MLIIPQLPKFCLFGVVVFQTPHFWGGDLPPFCLLYWVQISCREESSGQNTTTNGEYSEWGHLHLRCPVLLRRQDGQVQVMERVFIRLAAPSQPARGAEPSAEIRWFLNLLERSPLINFDAQNR